MKKVILASVVASIAASSAFAGGGRVATGQEEADVKWVGTVTDLEDVCVFTENKDGKMTYAENADNGGGVWTVTEEAVLKLSVRDTNNSSKLMVKAGDEIYRSDASMGDQLTSSYHTQYAVTVDYAGSTVEVSKRHQDEFGTVVVDNPTGSEFELSAFAMGKHMTVNLGGTATMNYDGAYIDNGEYTITHEATCLQ